MRPRDLIVRYLELRQTMTSPPSATGYQIDGLRLGTLGTGSGNAQEELRSYFSHLAYAMGRLNDFELAVVSARWTPCGFEPKEREVRDGDLIPVIRDNPDGTQERTQATHAGEVFLRAATRDGFVIVLGSRPLYPTREKVAEQLRVTFAEVKQAIKTAYRKIENIEDA